MLIVLVVVLALVAFVAGLGWPRRALILEWLVGRLVRPVERWANGLRRPWRWLVKGPAGGSRRIVQKSARKGREVRDRLRR